MSSAIVNFYNGSVNVDGLMLEDILKKRNSWLQATHSWVQWLFPTKEASRFSPTAPILTDKDFMSLYKHQGLVRSTDRMLNFMGIKRTLRNDPPPMFPTYYYELGDNFEEQKYTWFTFNDNSLRITRFLTSLSILGFRAEVAIILTFMKEKLKNGGSIPDDTMAFWRGALEAM